jgi:hypothetical protein
MNYIGRISGVCTELAWYKAVVKPFKLHANPMETPSLRHGYSGGTQMDNRIN